MLRNRLSFWTCNIFQCILHKIKSTELVFFIDHDILASFHELLFDLVTEVVVDVTEGKGILIYFVVFQPLHRFVELVVLGLKVFKLKLLAENHLVESTGEIGIYQFFLNERFADKTTYKFEVV